VDFIPFLGSFINSHEIKIGLPTFAPFFHHFFKTKYFFQKLKALERDKVVFHFYFFSPNVWVITLCYYLLAYQKELYKKRHIFFILLSLFLGFKNEISFHIFHILFFFLLSIYPLAKWYVIHSFHLLNCDAIGWIFLYNYCWEE